MPSFRINLNTATQSCDTWHLISQPNLSRIPFRDQSIGNNNPTQSDWGFSLNIFAVHLPGMSAKLFVADATLTAHGGMQFCFFSTSSYHFLISDPLV